MPQWLKICPQYERPGFDPWVGKILRRRAWQLSPVFLSRESPWIEEPGRLHVVAEWDTMEGLSPAYNSTISIMGQVPC